MTKLTLDEDVARGLREDIARAVAQRTAGQYTGALAILLDLANRHPEHAVLQYEIACTYDPQGLEADAIPHYERALELGLKGETLRGALLGLGSSYRCVEQYADAVRTLERGMNEFPNANEFAIFMAMALHNMGQHAHAMELLLKHIAAFSSDESTKRYERAIHYYADHLQPPYE
jgi:tetratricopeptide (TPR) repeat protein